MTTIESLKCFRLEGKSVQASSLHLGALLTLPDGLNFEKPIYVSAVTMTSIASRLAGTITIELTDKAITISDSTSSFKLPLMVSDGFPSFPECTAKYAKAPFIYQAIKAASSFTTETASSPVYSGVRIRDNEIIATDHKVLTVTQLGASTKLDAVVGVSMAEHFGADENAEVAVDQNRVFVRSSAGVIFGNTLEGKFLDPETFTRKWKFPLTFVVKRDDLKIALPKINIIGRDKDVTWAICVISNEKMHMETTRFASHVSVDIPVQGKGEARFRINTQMVDKWFQHTKDDEIKMHCEEGLVEKTPIKFEGKVTDTEALFTAYIMPMLFEVPGGLASARPEE
jgi:DNA polymerase III sliding clamp (beta) subunit (PCNA family)